jgi:hypothetical protein
MYRCMNKDMLKDIVVIVMISGDIIMINNTMRKMFTSYLLR